MSIPSASWAVQMGVMVIRASAVWRQRLPAMEPESSITKIVSKVSRKAYASSAMGAGAEGLLLDALGWTAAFGAAVYAGGASREDALWDGFAGAAGGLLVGIRANSMIRGVMGLPGRRVGCAAYLACGCEGCDVVLLADCLFLDSEFLSEPKIPLLCRRSIVDVLFKRCGFVSVDMSRVATALILVS
jgi:hypothetical protein